jgi:hypothetical protein
VSPLWTKLNLKDHRAILVLDPPSSFEPALFALLKSGVAVHRDPDAVAEVAFAMAFVTTRAAVAAALAAVLPKAPGDAVLWFAYPRGTSKTLAAEINRDRGWEPAAAAGLEAVRQVALDADWSALRFRRREHIPKLTRRPREGNGTDGSSPII